MIKLKTLLLSAVILLSSLVFADDRQSTTTIVDPVGNVTIQTFFGPYPFETKVFKGSSTLLSTTDSCYNGATLPCAPALVAVPVTQKDVYSTIAGVSAGPSQAEVTYNTYGLVTDSKVYDFGPTLVNDGVTVYASLGNAKIRNRPSSTTTKNSGGTTVSQTTYTYDSFGDVLTRNMLVGGSTFLTESFTYTAKGMVATSTGVNGAVTTYSNSLCGGTAVSAMTYPVTGAQNYTWNCNGYVPTSITDVNGSVFSVAYADPFWRPTSSVDSLGTTITYKYTPKTQETITAFGNSVTDQLITINPAGRAVVSQLRQSGGSGQYDTSSQAYDTLGRRTHVSVPCVSSSSSPCPAVSITASYDSGSKPTTMLVDALGGVVSTQYFAEDETTLLAPAPAGEGIKGKQLEYDGLGRLTSVCEISTGPGSGSCGQRVAQTGYVTTYTHDATGNVTTITQGSQTRTLTYDDLGRVLTSTQPETGTTTYTYDTTGSCGGTTTNGSLVKTVDNAGNTICYKYDSVSRLTSITHSGPNATDDAFYVYDSATVGGHVMANTKGRLAEAYTCTSCPGTKKTDIGFSYDILGQIVDQYESTTNSGGYYHVAVTVYPNQSIHTLQVTPAVIPVISYGLDGEGRVSSVQAGSNSLVVSTARGPANQITSLTYGSSDVDAFGYDALLRMTQYAFSVGGNSITGTLAYNANGTVSGRSTVDPFSTNESCSYSYDDLVRLSKANCGATNQTFSYDRYGNITKSGTFSFSPTYSTSTNRVTGFTYDSNGNVLTDGTSTYTWDAEGRMLSGPGVDSIIYDAMNRMAEQTRGSAHQQIVYFPSGEPLALMNGQALNLARVPLPGGAQAVYTSAGLAYYSHVDAQGSVRVTTTPASALSSDLLYAPFGEPYNNAGVPTSVLSFTGHTQDTIVGLYDTPTRKYNPLQSRWVSSDMNGKSYSGDPQSFNLYSYVTNRPLSFTDSTGSILDNSNSDDGSDLPYGPGLFGNNIQDPSSYDPYGFLNSDSEKPLVYNSGEPAAGAGGSYATWDIINSALFKADPMGLVAGVDIPEPFFVGPYEGAENVIRRLAKAIEGLTGTGRNSLKNIEDLTYEVLDKYGSLTRPNTRPQLAMGLTNPGMTREEVKALYKTGNFRSGLNAWADSIGAKSWSSFPIDSRKGLNRGLFTLMDNVRDAGGTIHFNLDGLEDIPAAVAGKSKGGTMVESIFETDWLGRPVMIKVPYNTGVTINELRYLKNNWEFFNSSVIFYKDGLPMLTPESLQAGYKVAPYVPW